MSLCKSRMEPTTTNGVRNGGTENGSATKRVKMSGSSIFDGLPVFPPDAIFHVKASFIADKDPRKVNLGVGGMSLSYHYCYNYWLISISSPW